MIRRSQVSLRVSLANTRTPFGRARHTQGGRTLRLRAGKRLLTPLNDLQVTRVWLRHPVRAVCSRTSVRAPTRSTLGYSIRVGLATLVSGPYGQSVKRFFNSFNFVCCSLSVFGRARRAKPATAHLRGAAHTHAFVGLRCVGLRC